MVNKSYFLMETVQCIALFVFGDVEAVCFIYIMWSHHVSIFREQVDLCFILSSKQSWRGPSIVVKYVCHEYVVEFLRRCTWKMKNLSHGALNVASNQLTKSSLWHIGVSVSASSDCAGAAKQVLVLLFLYYSCTCDMGSESLGKCNVNMSFIFKKNSFALCFVLQNIFCSASVHCISLQLKCI